MINHIQRWGLRLSMVLMVALLRPACGSGGSGGSGILLPLAAAQGNLPICTAAQFQMTPRLVSDGTGGAFVFWLDFRSGTWNVYAQKLNGLGAPLWTADGIPVTTTGSANFTGLAAVSDGAGGAIVLWSDFRSVDAGGIDLYAQRINSGGSSLWTANGISVLTTLQGMKYPQAIPDGAGGVVVLAQETPLGPSPTMSVRVQKITSAGAFSWGSGGVLIASNLNRSGLTNTVRLVSDGAGGAIAAWDSSNAMGFSVDDIFAQRIDASGVSLWTAGGVPLCATPSTQRQPDLVPDGSGGAILVWSDDRNVATGWDLYAQRLNSLGQAQWAIDGAAVVTRPDIQFLPRLAGDGAGGAILVFPEPAGDGFRDLFAQRIGPTGTTPWGPQGVPICVAADEQWTETVVADGAGGAVIVWKDFRSETSYDLYAQSIDSSAAVRWGVNGTRVSVAAYNQGSADVLALATDRAFFAWIDDRSGVETWDVYGQVVRMDATASPALPVVNPSTPWTAFNWPVASIGGNQINGQGIPDGSGGAILIWADQRPNAQGLYMQRIGPTGLRLWNPTGIPVTVNSGGPVQPRIASDGAGGAIVTWEENRTTNFDIYAQRVAPDGSFLWAPTGVPVVAAAGDQRTPQIVPDGAGGAVVAWEDLRASGTNSIDLYAQRLDSLGNRLWNTQGIAVSATSVWEARFQIIPDGAAGAFVVWDDDRNSATTKADVFAQRVDAAGTLPWGAPVAVCAGAEDQTFPVIVPDAGGGLIAAWNDSRSAPAVYQIFGQRLNASGVPQWAANGVPIDTLGGGFLYMVPDGAGGAILSCRSFIAGVNAVFGLRVESTGMTPWGTGGIRMSLGDPAANIHGMLSDGAGGAFVAWGDQGNRNLFLQRVDGSGVLLLGSGGIPISTADGFQGFPFLIPDGSSGVIAAWGDYRRSTSGSHLYTQRLNSDGTP